MLSGVKDAILHIECALNVQYYTTEGGRKGRKQGRGGVKDGKGGKEKGRRGKGKERERGGREGTVRGGG